MTSKVTQIIFIRDGVETNVTITDDAWLKFTADTWDKLMKLARNRLETFNAV